MMKIQGQQL